MNTNKEFEIFCQFSAICKKYIRASSFEDAKIIAQSEKQIHFDEIIQFITPCRVDEVLSHEIENRTSGEHNDYDFKNWGSEKLYTMRLYYLTGITFMNNEIIPIPTEDMILLRAYLVYVIKIEKQCSNNFSHTEWYLFERYTTKEIQTILEYFRSIGIRNDRDIIEKIN